MLIFAETVKVLLSVRSQIVDGLAFEGFAKLLIRVGISTFRGLGSQIVDFCLDCHVFCGFAK